MMIKYRVHEVAKDINIPSKDIIDLLARYYDEPRKHMTALTEEELNLVFEHYSKDMAVENFDAYFAIGEEKRKEAQAALKAAEEVKAVAQQAAKLAAQEAAHLALQEVQAQQQALRAAQAAEQLTKQQARPQQPAQSALQQPMQQRPPYPQQNRGPQNPQQGAMQNRAPQSGGFNQNRNGSQPYQQHGNQPFHNNNQPRPPQTQQPRLVTVPQPARPVLPKANAADRTVRVVDTRGSQVELEKYNEHYEQIATDSVKKDNNVQGKQKIKQHQQGRRFVGSRKETDSEKIKRLAMEKARKIQLKVTITEEITVGELAARLKVTAAGVIKKLIGLGVMASISDVIDYDTAALVAIELGAKVEKEVVVTIEDKLIDSSDDIDENLESRSPVVVVMGHVDHGKTSLLDAIRNSDVVAGEAGGITQHIGAYRVKIQGKEITFLDTPGHEAFTSMRARGAQATDIAVLVVAADDGIMPQTVEAINHAKAANVSIIVAINKMDKPGANPERIKQEMTEYGLVPEEWGGDTICVNVSAIKHENIDKLLETILLVAEMKNLRANPKRAAKGTVIEARLDKGRGTIATILVQNGTLRTGDVIIAGTTVGRVRAMTDEKGQKLDEAGPSIPVEITGLSEAPLAGDVFYAVKDERMARELAEQRRTQEKEVQFGEYQKVTLENLFDKLQEGEIKDLNIIVKADVQGSVEAIKQSLEKLTNEEVRVRVIHGGVGAISETDVYLAESSNAIIVAFNVRPDIAARNNAEAKGIELRMYRVIYDCIEDVKAAMKGMLAPKFREIQYGRAEVRSVFKITNAGTIAGCYVLEGKIVRNSLIRIVRDGIVITEDKIDSLKRFKDDAKEVAQGFECGVGLDKYNDIREGDVYESFVIEEYRD